MTRRRLIVVALGLVLLVAVVLGILRFGWDWKALIGWRALVDYIDPKNATGRKDAVQVYALIVAGVATITAAVGLANLWLTRRNLVQQRELEEQRGKQQRELEAQRAEQQRELAQGTALQAYYEQIGNLITEYDLRTTQREEIRELARGQTLTVLREVDGKGKGSLLTFLYGAGLIGTQDPAVVLTGADLREAALQGRTLSRVDLRGSTSEMPTSGKPTSKEPASGMPTSPVPTSKEPTSETLTSKEPSSEEPTSKEPTSKEPKSLTSS